MITAFTRLHYGADLLGYVIKSTEGFADRHIIMYTPVPTFGRNSARPCPDTRDQLHRIAMEAGGDRVLWLDTFPDARTAISIYPDAGLALELDADEIIHPQLANNILSRYQAGELTASQYALPMIHHWRSFDHVCKNPGWPGRLYVPHGNGQLEYFPGNYEAGVIHHFGYARSRADMLYKVDLSVHNPEWRAGWWKDKYDAFPHVTHDVHPTCIDMWDVEPYDKTQLPEFMKSHPYYHLEVID